MKNEVESDARKKLQRFCFQKSKDSTLMFCLVRKKQELKTSVFVLAFHSFSCWIQFVFSGFKHQVELASLTDAVVKYF